MSYEYGASVMDENLLDLYTEEDISNRRASRKAGRRCYYPSNKAQTFIRNAVTGVAYPFKVGSKEQSQLFKMVDTRGVCDADGYTIPPTDPAPNPNTNHLFYDSPEQCMSNLRISLSPETISQWRTKST